MPSMLCILKYIYRFIITNIITSMTNTACGSQKIDGSVKLRVFNEEVGTSLQEQRVCSLI